MISLQITHYGVVTIIVYLV